MAPDYHVPPPQSTVGELSAEGAIEYTCGSIRIVDASKLAEIACERHEALRQCRLCADAYNEPQGMTRRLLTMDGSDQLASAVSYVR